MDGHGSKWTVIRLKVDGPTNSTRQIPSTKMADIRSKNPLFMTIAVSYSRTKVNCLKAGLTDGIEITIYGS